MPKKTVFEGIAHGLTVRASYGWGRTSERQLRGALVVRDDLLFDVVVHRRLGAGDETGAASVGARAHPLGSACADTQPHNGACVLHLVDDQRGQTREQHSGKIMNARR